MTGDKAIYDNGRHLFAKLYEPARTTKTGNYGLSPYLYGQERGSGEKSRSGSITPDNIVEERKRRVSYAGRSKVCNYGYVGETRERMFDILINSQKAMSKKVFISCIYNNTIKIILPIIGYPTIYLHHMFPSLATEREDGWYTHNIIFLRRRTRACQYCTS